MLVLSQVFLVHYPRLVILLVAVVNLAVITSGFSVYHLMLAVTNQTINERYKQHYYKSASTTAAASYTNYYHQGVLLNLFEEFLPLQHARFCCSKRIKGE